METTDSVRMKVEALLMQNAGRNESEHRCSLVSDDLTQLARWSRTREAYYRLGRNGKCSNRDCRGSSGDMYSKGMCMNKGDLGYQGW